MNGNKGATGFRDEQQRSVRPVAARRVNYRALSGWADAGRCKCGRAYGGVHQGFGGGRYERKEIITDSA